VNGQEPERQTVPEKEQQNPADPVETSETAKEQVQTSTSPNRFSLLERTLTSREFHGKMILQYADWRYSPLEREGY
jgi:hypothetical protein